MTNKEDGDASCDGNPRMAALLAVHLVSQILDEAYVIANAALDTGEPWRNLSMFKSLQSNISTTDDKTLEALKADCEVNENKAEMAANVVVTSTPQKLTRLACSDEGEVSQSILIHNDINPFIGQGDQDIETENELANSTSMFINHLFDMSDVERIVMCDDTEIIQSPSNTDAFIADAMNKLLIPLEVLEGFPLVPNVKIIEGDMATAELSRSDESDYSFMADAFAADIKRDVAFYIEENKYSKNANDTIVYQPAVVEEIVDEISIQNDDMEEISIENKENTVSYEDAYATLNRDYDQGSEEDAFPILQDPKTITLQEVELLTGDTSDEELAALEHQKEQKPIESVATVSGVSGSRKTNNTFSKRCRMQGARILACLRGWWRKRTPGKRKDRGHGGLLGPTCPLSPDARRRASSLWDNRLLRSPSPTRPAIWKFNTVNEALVNSNHWKDYTFDPKPDDCGEASDM